MGAILRNSYICPKCNHQWNSFWTSVPYFDSSSCNERPIAPFYSIELSSEAGVVNDPNEAKDRLISKLNFVFNQLELALDMDGFLDTESLDVSVNKCQEILEVLKAFGIIEVDSKLVRAFE